MGQSKEIQMKEREMDLDRLVANADPAREVYPPSGTSAKAQWTYVQVTRSKASPLRWMLRSRMAAPLLGAVLLAIALVVSVNVFSDNGHQESAAAAIFRQAARAAEDRAPIQLVSGQYLYSTTKSLYQSTIYKPAPDP